MSWNRKPKPTEPWHTLYMMAASQQRAGTELLRGFVTHTHAHTDTRVLHPLTRNLRLGTSVCAARPLAILRSNRASESKRLDPHVGKGSIAERVRKDLECVRCGPMARVDVTMSCSEKCYSRPTSGQTGMGALHSGRCQRQDREAFPHLRQASFFARASCCTTLHYVRPWWTADRSAIPARPLAAVSPWARRREGAPETFGAVPRPRRNGECTPSSSSQAARTCSDPTA